MSIISPKTLFENAIKNNYAVGAFNVFDLETLQAVIGAAEKEHSAAVIQVSMGARKYAQNFEAFIKVIKIYAEASPMPFIIHHDHCTSVENCFEAVDAGMQSVMFDGSHHDFETNIALTKQVTEYAHAHGAWVEAELGCLPGFEDKVFGENAVFTNPKLVPEFIARSGCDSLAVAAGTSHGGVKAEGYLPLDSALIKKIAGAMPGYPFVLHGAASLPPELIGRCNEYGAQVEFFRNCSEQSISEACKSGICKANMDVDNFLVFTTAIRRFFLEKPGIYDPRKYLAPARDAFESEVRHKMRDVTHSSGQY